MCKTFPFILFLLAMMVSFRTQANESGPLASWPPGANWQSTARPTTILHPRGCLYLGSRVYVLQGRFGGIALPAYPEEDPPIEARSFIYFFLDKPISVCASKESGGKAWINIHRLASGVTSDEYYHYLVKYWGQWEQVRITASLLNVETALPGPIGIYKVSKVCFRGKHKGKVGSLWWCMSGKTWDGLYQESEQWINGNVS